jgi:nucleotide-binding universal stress UspA family protein
MSRIERIVVGVASLHGDDIALPGALALAARVGAQLHVVHVYDLPDPIQSAYARELVLGPGVLESYGETLQQELDASLASLGGMRAIGHVVEGSTAECLDELVRELGADLLVLGATRRGRLWKQFLGVTAEGVIRRATVPVLVLRRSDARPARRVLFTTDLSSVSQAVQGEALGVVRELCGEGGTEMRTLLVVRHEHDSLQANPHLLRRVAESELERFLREVREGHGGPVGSARVRVGETTDEIVSEAMEWGADLVVVGTHGGRGGARFHLGSVAGAVLRGAACDVLVIPSTRAAQRAREKERAAATERPSRLPVAFAGPRLYPVRT